jgi:hypothetical protein
MCAAESSERWSERQAENMVLVQCDRDNPLVALGKPRDILDILREGSDRKTYPNWHAICKAAADEIERLRRDYSEAEKDHVNAVAGYHDATIKIARLRAERDEARRMVCSAYALRGRDIATERGWDCFKEER